MNALMLELWKYFSGVAPVKASKIMFFKTNHKVLDLKNPQWFDEKLQYLKLYKYSKDELASICADKYMVRNYVEKRGCKELLNALVFSCAFKTAEDIPWDKLPDQFVIKCTHGCKMNIICTDKSNLNKEATIKKLNKWLKEKQWKEQAELHYRKIEPRIIVEKYIDFDTTIQGKLPIDYKFYCFNGEPQLVLVCSNREDSVKYDYYDMNWNKVTDIVKPEMLSNEKAVKPESFNKMVEYCKRLVDGERFPFARIDFYESKGKPIFGEITLTPSGCNDDDYTINGQKLLGNMLQISDLINYI